MAPVLCFQSNAFPWPPVGRGGQIHDPGVMKFTTLRVQSNPRKVVCFLERDDLSISIGCDLR